MSEAIEEDGEVHDLETIIRALNKEIEVDTYSPSDNLDECADEDGRTISLEYGDKQYCLDADENFRSNTFTASGSEESRSRTITASHTTKPKVLNPSTVLIKNSQVKTENEKIVADSPNQEIYEFDELEELRVTGEVTDQRGKTSPKLTPVIRKNSNSVTKDKWHFVCPHCDYTAPKRYMLSRHMKTHSDVLLFVCSVCDKAFTTKHTLKNHINVHLGNKPYACKSCEKCFTTPSELQRHIRYKHTHDKRHKCTECDYATVELSKLRCHIRTHTGERPYQCPHCTYASPDNFKLKRHLRTHTGEKPYQCDICQSRFTQSNSLKSHRLIHSVDDKPVFQCALCPTTCSRKADLRIHVQNLHYSDTPLPCWRCGKELPDRYSYKMHFKTHAGERCFRCDLCHHKSISMRNLQIHKQIHSNEKPFACELCDQTFRQKQLLTRHTNLYHTINNVPPPKLEKIHHCPYCSRSFAHKGNMVRHMQIHDNTPDQENRRTRLYNQHEDEYILGDESINGEIYEEFEVINEAETKDIDNYVIVETIEPTTSKSHSNLSSNMVQSKVAIDENEPEFQNIQSIVKIEETDEKV
ncbi:gastrula zinc finger protein XlCGF57.1-like [Eurosta solidaginis]|uniref:gastrula zinc finger protein XlCGF57.1-like n=1 Tax=Eurosta solidaginis TaxID=178769 RepID=UPI00353092BB